MEVHTGSRRRGAREPTSSVEPRLRALVVHQSVFEDTETIARAVARGLVLEGLASTTVPVAAAPALADVTYDLVVVGAPMYAFALSNPRTRSDAARQSASGTRAETGIRDWLAAAGTTRGARRPLAAMFDTRVRQTRHPPSSAAFRGRHLLQHLGFIVIAPPQGFLVEGVRGPTASEEIGHAVAWGRGLARTCQDRRAASAVASGRG